MHKRARNHKYLVDFQCRRSSNLGQIVSGKWKEYNPKYKPQGKREAKKYTHTRGLLQLIQSTFKEDK